MLSKGNPVAGELSLGFGLQLAGGRGVLSCRDRRVGPFRAQGTGAEVPELDGPPTSLVVPKPSNLADVF